MPLRPIRRALLSVSDKNGIIEFATALAERGVELLSTGGTARLLADSGLTVTEVSDYTGYPEMMDGRVKTLHPKIHGGILGRRGTDDAIMANHSIQPIDMVVVNLYPFAQTVSRQGCSLAEAIENIDIGGPAMLRSAAKNHADVTVVVNSQDYQAVINEMDDQDHCLHYNTRFNLAIKAFEHTANYDSMIANYFGQRVPGYFQQDSTPAGKFPRTLNLNLLKKQDMRYGENSHQQAALYIEADYQQACVATAQQIQGKALSYNNIADTDTALECVRQFEQPACVIVKHANPCGVATDANLQQAYLRAYQTDPTSAFGGIIAFNRELDGLTATTIIEQQFVEVIIAPAASEQALLTLSRKPNVRLLLCGTSDYHQPSLDFKRVKGGLLLQDYDDGMIGAEQMQLVTKRSPTAAETADAMFSWKVAKFVKSNAIVYAKEQMTVGIGAGQMSRVYSARIASIKAADQNLSIQGAAMASDAFFPFRDSVDAAAVAGVTCIIQPGGSIRDGEVIAAADQHNIAMFFTGMRHFRH